MLTIANKADTASSRSSRLQLVAVILTFNEDRNLPVSLASLLPLKCPVFLVDSGSTDKTHEIASQLGAIVLQHEFENHSAQWAWALSAIPDSEWVLALDADQRLTPELQQEVIDLFGSGQNRLSQLEGIYINRRQIFRGRWIKHGGYYPKYLLKLFRRGSVVIDSNDLVDHHFYVNGPTICLQNDIIEDNKKEHDITVWIEKHNRYATLFATEEISRKRYGIRRPIKADLLGNPDERTLGLKNVWFRLPRYVRPALLFTYRYVVRVGFLDGEQALIFHFLQSFWFRFLVDIKISELIRQNPITKTNGGSISGPTNHLEA